MLTCIKWVNYLGLTLPRWFSLFFGTISFQMHFVTELWRGNPDRSNELRPDVHDYLRPKGL